MNLFDIGLTNLDFLDGSDLLNLTQCSKEGNTVIHGKLPLWKCVYYRDFGLSPLYCMPKDFKKAYVRRHYVQD